MYYNLLSTQLFFLIIHYMLWKIKHSVNYFGIATEMDNVISVFPNKNSCLHTTRSWNFVGLPQNVKRATTKSDIIVGVLDT